MNEGLNNYLYATKVQGIIQISVEISFVSSPRMSTTPNSTKASSGKL